PTPVGLAGRGLPREYLWLRAPSSLPPLPCILVVTRRPFFVGDAWEDSEVWVPEHSLADLALLQLRALFRTSHPSVVPGPDRRSIQTSHWKPRRPGARAKLRLSLRPPLAELRDLKSAAFSWVLDHFQAGQWRCADA